MVSREKRDFGATKKKLKCEYFGRRGQLPTKAIVRSQFLRPVTHFGVEDMLAFMHAQNSTETFPLTVMEIPPEDLVTPIAAQMEVRYVLLDGGHRLAALDKLWHQAPSDRKELFNSAMCVVYKPMPVELQMATMESMCSPTPLTTFLSSCCVSLVLFLRRACGVCLGFCAARSVSRSVQRDKGQFT